jgi:hypothetical protein
MLICCVVFSGGRLREMVALGKTDELQAELDKFKQQPDDLRNHLEKVSVFFVWHEQQPSYFATYVSVCTKQLPQILSRDWCTQALVVDCTCLPVRLPANPIRSCTRCCTWRSCSRRLTCAATTCRAPSWRSAAATWHSRCEAPGALAVLLSSGSYLETSAHGTCNADAAQQLVSVVCIRGRLALNDGHELAGCRFRLQVRAADPLAGVSLAMDCCPAGAWTGRGAPLCAAWRRAVCVTRRWH